MKGCGLSQPVTSLSPFVNTSGGGTSRTDIYITGIGRCTFGLHGPKMMGGHLHGEAICTYNIYIHAKPYKWGVGTQHTWRRALTWDTIYIGVLRTKYSELVDPRLFSGHYVRYRWCRRYQHILHQILSFLSYHLLRRWSDTRRHYVWALTHCQDPRGTWPQSDTPSQCVALIESAYWMSGTRWERETNWASRYGP